jgi:hypothetical protein
MRPQHLALVAATALAVAPLAAAAQQTTEATAYQEAEDDDMVVQPFNLTVDDLEDMNLESAAGDDIGEVEEVLTDGTGQPVAVAVEVGGFLGIGEREVVFPLDQLQLVDDGLVTSADRATIEALPDWED